MSKDPENLQGGSIEVTKVGDRVLHTRRQGSTNTEWPLTVLERRGFRCSPEFPGPSDNDRQVLEFVEGQASAYPLSEELHHDEVLISAARALRLPREVTNKPVAEVLNGWVLGAVKPYEVICHGNLVLYNCVFDGSRLIGVINFDTMHPGPYIRDTAYAIYHLAPLTASENAAGFGSLAEQTRRARSFYDEHGEVNQSEIIEAVCRRLFDLVRCMHTQTAQGDTAFQSHLGDGHDTLYPRDIHYLRVNAATLTRALM